MGKLCKPTRPSAGTPHRRLFRHVKEFNDSLLRCLRQEGFLETFYGRFAAASEEIAALFAGCRHGSVATAMEGRTLYMRLGP